MKIAIGFFGLTRSLTYTIYSIRNNIYNVLNAHNIEYDVFLHTYRLNSYNNRRTNEKITNQRDIEILNNEYKLLKGAAKLYGFVNIAITLDTLLK